MITVQAIINAIKSRNYTVAIVGMGYVGLPLLLSFYAKKFNVIGIDNDLRKISMLCEGKSFIKHIDSKQIQKVAFSEKCSFTSDYSVIKEANAILICVPTPLTKQREPDMSCVINTITSMLPFLKPGHLIVLESTTYPGATDECVKHLCESSTPLRSEEDLFIAYSPEREDPGNPDFNTATIPKVVGGDGEKALAITQALYSEVIVKVLPVSNLKTAEAVKITENVFRAVNIALVNELKIIFNRMGVDINEVIQAAKSKPFGYMPFYPGPGLGGHCIPIDPFYLTWKAREFGLTTRFIELAGEINIGMPHYVVKKLNEALNEKKKSIKGSKILCLGLAYKPNIDDMRESPTFTIMDILSEQGALVDYYDPYISVIVETSEHRRWAGKRSILWNEKSVRNYDAAIIVTDHNNVNYEELLEWCEIIVDTRHVYKNMSLSQKQVWKA